MSHINATPNSSPVLITAPVQADDFSDDLMPTIAQSAPQVQLWLNQWVHAVYAREPLPELPAAYCIPPSAACVALTEAFDTTVQTLVAQYPEEHRTNQLIPILVMGRALVAWQTTFSPQPSDWLNLRTNLGYYQQKHEKQWRQQFEGPRPSALSWLSRLTEAVGYELTEKQLVVMSKSLKSSENAQPRFWSTVSALWSKFVAETPPACIQDNLNLCTASITVALQMQNILRDDPTSVDLDTFPPFVHNMEPLDLAVPVRDYQKGWDYHIRVNGRAFAVAQAKSHYPEGIPDSVEARISHVQMVEQYYDLFERSFEPWRWDGLNTASVDEQAQTWAWLTSWAPEYHWDTTVSAIGIHPPVEAIGREYTGQATQWWLTSPHADKVQAATAWIQGASFEMDAARREHCNIDNFIGGMFGR